MKIKKKKCFKVNIYILLIFQRWKNTNILPPISFQVKNVIFFGDFGQKNWKGWSDNVETFQKEKSIVFEKKI